MKNNISPYAIKAQMHSDYLAAQRGTYDVSNLSVPPRPR